MKPRSQWTRRLAISSTGVVLLAVSLVALNVVAGLLPLRVDITHERLFTLSEGSEHIVRTLAEPVTLKFYFSESLPNVPVGVKSYARKVVELLQGYRAASGGKLSLEIYDPKPDTDDEEWAVKYGMHRVGLPDGNNLIFGMVALSGEREMALPFFDPRRESVLEYEISQSISEVTLKDKPTLGILGYLKMAGEPAAMPGQQGTAPWAVMDELKKGYKIEYLFPTVTAIPESIKTLLVVHPKFPPPHLAYAIDQFLMRGGRLMIFTDPNSRMDDSEMTRAGVRFNYSNFPVLFDHWGLKFDKTKVIGDQELATRVNTQSQGVVDFPLWISFRGSHLNHDSVITNQLEEVTLIDGGAFEFEAKTDGKLTFTPLLTTSAASGTIDSVMAQMAGPLDVARTLKPDGNPRVLAGLLTGMFDTAFPAGPPKAEGVKQTAEDLELLNMHHLSKTESPTSVLVVGDADFIADHFSVQRVSLFGYTLFQPINDNLNFVMNAVEFLSGSQDLIKVRSRGTFSRPFTTVLSLQRAAQEKYQAQEQRLSTRLEEVRNRLSQLEAAGKGGEEQKFIFTPEMITEVERFRKEEQATRQALRDVRKVLRQDIESLGTMLLTLNLLAVPVLVAIVGAVGYLRRNRKRGGRA